MIKTGKATNDAYAKFIKVWLKMRDSLQGEEHMKNRSLVQNSNNLEGNRDLKAITTFDQYLRPTDSMRRLGSLGYQRFCDYIYRAKYYPFPLEIQSQSLGLIENEPASFELPSQLEFMKTDATTNNEDLAKVLSIINTQQLQVSRVGLLLNPSNEVAKQFNIGLYAAESIVDWNEYVKADSETAFDWIKLATDECDADGKPIFLILMLDEEGVYTQYKTINELVQYGDNFESDDGYILGSLINPMVSETTLDEIPFVIVNVTRLGAAIERPFIESVTDAAISLFRASAHHEDALYWGGESTLFTAGYGTGEDAHVFVGNGAVNTTNSENPYAEYVTMGTDGIEPRKANVDGLFEYCVALGVDLLNKGNESGAALNIRSNVKTASLKTLALTGALGLEMLLKIGAKWISANPDEVIVTANTQFADVNYTSDDFVKFSSMVTVGAMREVDLYNLQKKNNITTAETYEQWKSELEKPIAPTVPKVPDE